MTKHEQFEENRISTPHSRFVSDEEYFDEVERQLNKILEDQK